VDFLVGAMSENRHIIPVWFFVGLLLLIYGALIFASGLADFIGLKPAKAPLKGASRERNALPVKVE